MSDTSPAIRAICPRSTSFCNAIPGGYVGSGCPFFLGVAQALLYELGWVIRGPRGVSFEIYFFSTGSLTLPTRTVSSLQNSAHWLLIIHFFRCCARTINGTHAYSMIYIFRVCIYSRFPSQKKSISFITFTWWFICGPIHIVQTALGPKGAGTSCFLRECIALLLGRKSQQHVERTFENSGKWGKRGGAVKDQNCRMADRVMGGQ